MASISSTSGSSSSRFYTNGQSQPPRQRNGLPPSNGHHESPVEPQVEPQRQNGHEHEHEHENGGHSHSHSHSILGGGHSHGGEERVEGMQRVIAAWRGDNDRGSYITLVGLVCNVVLTGVKGLAGWYMHSASLLADAGHSLSDLLGDFVTLFCWNLSRKPPSERYPYGFAKFETVGTTTISLLLIGGALGIGFHSYHLLLHAFFETAATLPPGMLQDILQAISQAPAPSIGHAHVHAVDPNAAWFAAVSVVVKEWLYRITKKVADDERSPVLLANAIHHRSDAYSSVVALFAIIGTWMFPAIPLDPIGGLIVSVVILRQGVDLLLGAFGDLTDAGVPKKTRQSILKTLDHIKADSPGLLSLHDLRARRAGSMVFADVVAEVEAGFTVQETFALDQKISRALKSARPEISEVRVKFEAGKTV
ncbi:hypothetical protein BDN72DRAFT_759301 [Pluteus cervinus]|uniref:Uncharacterized protein n=1 Tax=Pluteus cervinus TaxID=181527 RepID=A0ACD3BAJ4_9AGAR|nr:hypothetical protein BDN72DRAFT_759301 [Pluteus cervinus]